MAVHRQYLILDHLHQLRQFQRGLLVRSDRPFAVVAAALHSEDRTIPIFPPGKKRSGF
ncbi:MAG: hypothetical protein WCD18_03375 [Thermosynechococcaceae cyanobacterium]